MPNIKPVKLTTRKAAEKIVTGLNAVNLDDSRPALNITRAMHAEGFDVPLTLSDRTEMYRMYRSPLSTTQLVWRYVQILAPYASNR